MVMVTHNVFPSGPYNLGHELQKLLRWNLCVAT